jgi:Domain of Unknown Function with PDB structure (DUF3857)/Transglutaminase-like superfamily
MRNILSYLLPVGLVCSLLTIPRPLAAQSWNALLIPDSLKKDTRVVEREEEITLEIKSPGKAITKKHQVFTVFNETGNSFVDFECGYNKFNSINSFSGTLYDAIGKELKHAKKKDMEDRAVSDGFSLMIDDRYKEYNFYYKTYPYTVEYEEEEELNGILGFEDWEPLAAPGVSTQHSKYVVIAPKDYLVRFKPVNCHFQPVITQSGDKKIYTWEISNLPARSTESSGPTWKEMTPRVLMAPSDFEADGYKGNMSTWAEYGKFINQLRQGRDVLPDDIRRKAHELTDNLKDPRQKVYALYDYLQKNTHYISIQLGIGGLQPFPATYVATKRYGDCKALSNYMVALLQEVGIKARYVEITAGKDAPDMVDDFPSFQGNHVISCVPMEKDTIWLECTDQSGSAGFMGSFTGGRKAILIDDDGAHIVQTPTYSSADNLQSRVVDAQINVEGNLDAEVNTIYTGISQEIPHGLMNELSGDQREKYLNELFNIPTYKVEKSRYEEEKGPKPVVREYLHVVSPNYANLSGKRLFISPNLFDKSTTRLAADSARKYDYVYNYAYKDVDSISIKIPAGYQPEAVPADIHIDSKYGKYNCSVKVSADKITYYRSREESVNRFAPSDYQGLVKFYEQLYKADHSRVVMVKE